MLEENWEQVKEEYDTVTKKGPVKKPVKKPMEKPEINYGPTLNKLFTIAKQPKNKQINELVAAAKVKEAEATQIINKIIANDI